MTDDARKGGYLVNAVDNALPTFAFGSSTITVEAGSVGTIANAA